MKIAVALLMLFFSFKHAFAAANDISEAKIKAALIVNFINFTRWPNTAFLDNPKNYKLCIAGDDPYSKIFDDYPEISVKGKTLQLHHLKESPSLQIVQTCHILIIQFKNDSKIQALLNKSNNKPVLTISESKLHEAMIIFVKNKGKVGFAINRTTAQKIGIDFSSKMLRLATSVVEDKV